MRIGIFLLGVSLIAGCGGEAVSTTQPPQFPTVVVDAWLEDMDLGAYADAASHVEPVGASIVLAVENGLSDDELASLLESGWSDALTQSFWSSFRSDFGLFSGSGLGGIVVGRHRPLRSDDGDYAAVEVDLDGVTGLIITRADEAGVWQIDLLATLDGAFAPLVFDRVSSLGAGSTGDFVAERFVTTALPSLEAAAMAYPDDIRLETEIARIRQALEAR